MTAGTRRCRLYLITPPRLDPAAFLPSLVAALDAGDVACLQLRLKGATDDEVRRAVAALAPPAQERGVAFLLNDRPDLAAATGCDGVHVGQQDASYAEARRILGPDRIVGVSCHASRHLALEAAEAGADYVAFGAFYPSPTKPDAPRADLALLRWWQETIEVPCVAIGGITVENCRPLAEAGADFVAVMSGVWDREGGPAAAVRAFARALSGD